MNDPKGIEEAVTLLRVELSDTDIESVEIRAEAMIGERQKGVILVWCNTYDAKRAVYEKYGEGEDLFPALYEGWEVRAKKFPPFVSKKKSKTIDDDNVPSDGEDNEQPKEA